MNKKLQVWLPFLFAVVMSLGIFLGYKMRDDFPGRDFLSIDKEKPLQQVMDLISKKYVDTIDMNVLGDTAIQAILSKLDPHSRLISANEVEATNDELAGNFYGVGIEYNIYNDTINVITVLPGGPAAVAGLAPGDKFIKVGDSLVAGKKLSNNAISKMFHGDKGSVLSVVILRGNQQKTIAITRDIVAISSVDADYMLTDSIGYIRLNMFTLQTHAEFLRALEALQKQGMKKLVLDLRDNGGGVLEDAVQIADDFLYGDKLITYTVGAHFTKKEYRCQVNGSFEEGPLVVLTDEGTASASEVLCGALQDWDRATIIGRRTFGKGLVQEQYDLNDGSALRLTVARYYTPIGRSIQRPYTNGNAAYFDEITDRYHDGEMLNADSIKLDSTKIYKTVGGRTVYGGGGIMPDIFVPLDTSNYTGSLAKIYTSSALSDFAYTFYLKNETTLNSYKTIADFEKGFSLTDDIWKTFASFAGINIATLKTMPAAKKDELALLIKASIARQIWRSEGFFEVSNTDDRVVKKAIEVINKMH